MLLGLRPTSTGKPSPSLRSRPSTAQLVAVASITASAAMALIATSACGDLELPSDPVGEDGGDSGNGGGGDAGTDAAAQGDGPYEPVTCDQSLPYPQYLGCTGLYSDWQKGVISPTAKEYRPGAELWADGADKSRWIELPAGSKIDVSDMNEWIFPIDTKVWKEFRLTIAGKPRKVETRLFWKIADGQWVRATYAWNERETNAVEVRDGQQNVIGTRYEIPTQSQCTTCHKGRKDMLLGFDAVLLASANAGGLTYAELVKQDLLSSTATPATPNLTIPGNAAEVAALGYIHANCGVSCHSGLGAADGSQCRLPLRLDVAPGTNALPTSVMDTPIAKNTVNVGLAAFVPPAATLAQGCRVVPQNAMESALHYRAAHRDPTPDTTVQMPSIGSHVVDEQGVAAINAWITGMSPQAGYPAPLAADAGCPRP